MLIWTPVGCLITGHPPLLCHITRHIHLAVLSTRFNPSLAGPLAGHPGLAQSVLLHLWSGTATGTVSRHGPLSLWTPISAPSLTPVGGPPHRVASAWSCIILSAYNLIVDMNQYEWCPRPLHTIIILSYDILMSVTGRL